MGTHELVADQAHQLGGVHRRWLCTDALTPQTTNVIWLLNDDHDTFDKAKALGSLAPSAVALWWPNAT
jgi:hypothetical protein